MSLVNSSNFRLNRKTANLGTDYLVFGYLFTGNNGVLFKKGRFLHLTGCANNANAQAYVYQSIFNGCSNIKNMDSIVFYMPIISRYMFSNSGIDTIKTKNITNIYVGAFQNCTNLTNEINLPNLIGIDSEYVFQNSGIRKISNLGKITTIGSTHDGRGIFGNCTGLTEVNLPPTLTNLQNPGCFQNDISLSKINLNYVTSVPRHCFNGCTALTGDLSVPNLTSIDYAAFRRTSFSRITNLGTITSLPSNADSGVFSSMSNLTEVFLPDTLASIGSGAFR